MNDEIREVLISCPKIIVYECAGMVLKWGTIAPKA
jgi:hypothetical protein